MQWYGMKRKAQLFYTIEWSVNFVFLCSSRFF